LILLRAHLNAAGLFFAPHYAAGMEMAGPSDIVIRSATGQNNKLKSYPQTNSSVGNIPALHGYSRPALRLRAKWRHL
jgi:hypothetical protein